MAGNNIRYQNPYLPNEGKYSELNVALTDWKYPGQLGTISQVMFKHADAVSRMAAFMIVRTAATLATATVAGSVLWWLNQDLNEVTTLATNRGRPAGIALRVCSVSSVVAIQILGYHPGVHLVAAPTAAAAATGNLCIPSATAAKADALALGTAATHQPLGYCVGAATGDFAPVYLTLGASY